MSLTDDRQRILDLGALRVETVDVKEIKFFPELRQACEQNRCGSFGKNWTCPPHCGEINELIAEASGYRKALVFQSVYTLEDSYDIEGMNEAHMLFRKLTNQVAHLFSSANPPVKLLSAGGCNICEQCGAIKNIPCRFPDIAYSSLEAHGIQVSELAASCGMKYINGANTVTYFGAVLVK